MRHLLSRRALSEVYGALLVAFITLSMSVAYVAFSSREASQQTKSITDIIRAAEMRQKQHLSLTYYYEQGNKINLYIFSYGSINATPQAILFDEELVFWRAKWKFEWFTVSDSGGSFGGKLGESEYLGEEFDWEEEEIEKFSGREDHVGYVAKAQLYFTDDSSTVNIGTEDGMEVYIDDQPVFGNAWHTQSRTTYTKTVSVTPGTHEVVVKWYGWDGDAYSSFSLTGIAEHSSLSMRDMETKTSCDIVSPKRLVEFTLPAPDSQTFDFILLTAEGGIFIWKVAT